MDMTEKKTVLEELKALDPDIKPQEISYSVDAAFFAHQKAKRNIRGFTSGLILTPDNKVILARRGKWFMPGGGVEIGEDFAAAMKREITEETGIDIYDLTLFAIDDEEFVSPEGDKVFSILAVFAARTDAAQLPSLTAGATEEGIEDMALFSPDDLPTDMALTDREKILTYFADPKLF